MKALNKYTLITGATSGIGYELAKLFAQDGHNLIIVARSEDGLDDTAVELSQQFGIDVVKISKDLFIPDRRRTHLGSRYKGRTPRSHQHRHTHLEDPGMG